MQDLVEAGANVNQRAVGKFLLVISLLEKFITVLNYLITGSFFLPRDQQKPRPAKHTDYEGLAYLGEYPLAWAACCANESVYNLLLDSGAHPDYQDNFGNMILHMVVVCDKLVCLKMYLLLLLLFIQVKFINVIDTYTYREPVKFHTNFSVTFSILLGFS